jgi:acyl-CoA thioesterase-1
MPFLLALILGLGLLEPSPVFANVPSLMILGDSLTAGFGLKPEEAYPAILEKKLASNDLSFKVINGGVSGDTTAGGLRRLAWMLDRASPQFLIIALGGNDMLRGLPLTQTTENIRQMIKLAQVRKIPVALVGVPAAPNMGEAYEKDFNQMFGNLARELKIPVLENYIDGVAGIPKLNLQDGIHPNAEGQKKVAENLYRFLVTLLEPVQKKQGESK